MKNLFIWYPKCSTCQKAKKWLVENGVDFQERHIVEEHPDAAELRKWMDMSGLPVKKFVNTSGILYREMGLKDKIPNMTGDEVIELLASNGMLVKRPILVSDGMAFAGFKDAEWEKIKG